MGASSSQGIVNVDGLQYYVDDWQAYLEDKIEYGQFHNTNGAELVPTVSLFAKSKIQHDGIMEWATHNLQIMQEEQQDSKDI